MTAYQIMNDHAGWITQDRSAWDCYDAAHRVTDDTDYWESRVLIEGTLSAHGIMEEAMK